MLCWLALRTSWYSLEVPSTIDFRKTNAFVDQRWEPNDESVEDVMWARVIRERTRRKKANVFNLQEENESEYVAGGEGQGGNELLTHKGQALTENYDSPVGSDDDEEAGKGWGAAATKRMHFGGDGIEGKRRSEILEEAILRGKQQKANKSRAKELQEDTREELDAGFGDLLGLLNQRPSGRENRGVRELDDYDQMAREVSLDSKAQATDRSKTPEEIASAERSRLEELERLREQRMRGEEEDDGMRGKAYKKKKKGGGGDNYNFEDLDEDENEAVSLPQKEENSSNGESVAARDTLLSESEEDSSDFDSDRGHTDGSLSHDDDNDEYKLEMAAKRSKEATEEIPYVLPCPQTYEELLSLITKYCTTGDDINTVIQRCAKYHSALADSRNREKLHNFYDVLLRHFVAVGEKIATSHGCIDSFNYPNQLHALSGVLFDIAQEMPLQIGALWRRILRQMQHKFATVLKNNAQSWPSPGHLILLKVIGDIFPVTDLRHPIATPAALLTGQYLSQCPVTCVSHIVSGLFCCASLLRWSSTSGRFAPEALSFLTGALSLFACDQWRQVAAKFVTSPMFHSITEKGRTTLGLLLRGQASSFQEDLGDNDGPPKLPLSAARMLEKIENGNDFPTPDVCVAIFGTIYSLLEASIPSLVSTEGFPEMVFPIKGVLSTLCPSEEPHALPIGLQKIHVRLHRKIMELEGAALAKRSPLKWQMGGVRLVKALFPKFEEGFVPGRGLDSEVKKLKKMVSREKKGAMRELRRDTEFLARVVDDDSLVKEGARKTQLRKNRIWLEEQQSTWKQQVGKKKSRGLMQGGGSSIKKRPKVGKF